MMDLPWQSVEALFNQLVILSKEEQASELAHCQAINPKLAAEVASLLEATTAEESLAVVTDELEALGLGEKASFSGKKIGAYRIQHPLGSGGTSTVFLAVRDDGTYHRQVAVKLLNAGFRSPEFLKLFYREQQILAGLSHPNIAQLLDAGHTGEGLPFLVTEYVEGVALDIFCRSQHLKVNDRIKVFFKVCHAVIYAHQNLIIHRDLKPGNILVNQSGEPVLLDFGFAKMLNANLIEKGTTSQIWMRMLTPAYASPEQFLGHPMTTTSDVYALGVILYELLCGRRPFDCSDQALAEVERRICEEQPLRPSQAVIEYFAKDPPERTTSFRQPPERVSRQLMGDLDAIILKALRKEPKHRYQSVADLVEDLKRYLTKRPVYARKVSFFYLCGKFFRRNKTMLAGFLFIIGMLIAFFLSQSRQAKHLANALQRSQIAQQNTDEAFGFLADLFRISDPLETKGQTLSAREFLDRAASRIFENLDGQPKPKIKLLILMGQVYINLGLYQEALTLLGKGLPVDESSGVSPAMLANYELLYGVAAFERGQMDDAQLFLKKALNRKAGYLGRHHPDLAANLFHLGRVKSAGGHFKEALAYFDEAEAFLKIAGRLDEEVAFQLAIAHAEIDIHFGENETAIARMNNIREQAVAQFGQDHPISFAIASQLGLAHKRKGTHSEAEKLYCWVLDRSIDLYGPDHPLVGKAMVNLGALLQDKGEHGQAETFYLKALVIQEKNVDPNHDDNLTTRANLASLYYRSKDYSKAAEQMEAILKVQGSIYGVGHPNVCRTRSNLAMTLNKLEERGKAESLLRYNLALLKDKELTNHDTYMLSLQNLGSVLVANGSFETALIYLRDADAIMREKGNKDLRFANNLCKLGFALCQVNQPLKAESILQEALRIYENILPPTDKRLAVIKTYVGYNLYLLGRTDEANTMLHTLFPDTLAYLGPENILVKTVRPLLEKMGDPLTTSPH